MKPVLKYALVISVLLVGGSIVWGEEGVEPVDPVPPSVGTSNGEAAADADALARKLANPVGSVYSVPVETTFDYGADNGDATFINIQPVIPVTLSEDWNLINRTVVPLIDAPGTPVGKPGNPEPESGPRRFGLGDINHSMFLSPANPGKVIWGAGSILSFPTATSSQLGSEKWSAGPTAVVLTQPKPWTMGLLAGNVWSWAGASDRGSVNQMFLQYFINYGFQGGWYLTTTPMMTANWNASSSDRWTIPVGGGVGKVFKIGEQNMRAQLQAFHNVGKPSGGPDWSLMFTVQFVFPRK
jgi:hypothetical protein